MEIPIDMPIIDFEAMTNGSPEERTKQLEELDKGFMTYGFVYLSNSSVPQEVVDEAFEWVSHNKRSKTWSSQLKLEPVKTFLCSST